MIIMIMSFSGPLKKIVKLYAQLRKISNKNLRWLSGVSNVGHCRGLGWLLRLGVKQTSEQSGTVLDMLMGPPQELQKQNNL